VKAIGIIRFLVVLLLMAAELAGPHFAHAQKVGAWTWGYNEVNQVGPTHKRNSPVPKQVIGMTGFTGIASGTYFNLALKPDGSPWGWGSNVADCLGDGTSTIRLYPVVSDRLSNVKALACGSAHTLALLSDGTVSSCGYNDHGELGDGTRQWRDDVVHVVGLT